jgi:hypothetical protein
MAVDREFGKTHTGLHLDWREKVACDVVAEKLR